MRSKAKIAALALLLGLAAGCTPVKPTATGSVFEDERIEKEAIARIRAQHLGEVQVSVASKNRRLLLTGEVPSQAARSQVEKLVADVSNVTGVSNELVIGDIIGIGARTSDSVIASDVKFLLLKEPDFPASDVKIVTEGGSVFLMGAVRRRDGALAGQLASTVSGVKRVVLVFEYVD